MLSWILNNKTKKKKVTMYAACLFLVAFFVFASTGPVFAQGSGNFGLTKIGGLLPLGGEDIITIAVKIIRLALSLIGILVVCYILYAGFLWMTSGGNEDKIAEAKKTIVNASVGLAVILSALAIVQFIISALAEATGAPGSDNSQGGGRGLNFDSYSASGALGRIVKDHYPAPNQKEVKRNTRISVTFFEAISPASIINNTNGNAIIGDCINTENAAFNWGPQFCDQLNTEAVRIFTGTSTPIAAAALTVLEGADQNAYTFMFRPLSLLGSISDNVDYTVDLTNNILKKDGTTPAFDTDRDRHYMWRFQTDISIDTDPPVITSIYPDSGSTQKRNSIVQINFNEAMDPIVTQGVVSPNTNFSNIIFHSRDITGSWKLGNGYKTAEFLSDIPCGQNSCGEMMYCLPVACSDEEPNCSNPYEVLVRTALTLNQNLFEAVALSGIMDMAGNALDNGTSNTPDGIMANPHRPGFVADEVHTIHPLERSPDNYNWTFKISNAIDREAPFIEKVTPNLDQENIDETATLTLKMSKLMSNFSLDTISLEEFPRPITLINENAAFENLADIWFVPRTDVIDGKSNIEIQHREFGPQGTNFYYFPSIPSSIKSVTQNCMYPGRGPYTVAKPVGGLSPECQYVQDENGQRISQNNCIPFPDAFTQNQDTGCVQYQDGGLRPYVTSTIDCFAQLRTPNISPRQPQPLP